MLPKVYTGRVAFQRDLPDIASLHSPSIQTVCTGAQETVNEKK